MIGDPEVHCVETHPAPLSWRLGITAANAVPRCGARAKHSGLPCQCPAMANRRCYMHGGASTGAEDGAGRGPVPCGATETR